MKYSIITACLNSEKTISKTIESLIAHNRDDFEHIIVDGKSSDNTIKIAETLSARARHKVIIVSEHDSGIYQAINRGLQISKGDYINILSSNDWHAKNALLHADNRLCSMPTRGIYSGAMQFVRPDGSLAHSHQISRPLALKIRFNMILPHPAMFIHRSIHDRIGNYNEKYRIAGDYDLLCRAWKNNVPMKSECDLITYMSSGGISDSPLTQKKLDLELNEIWNEHFPSTAFLARWYTQVVRARQAKKMACHS